MQTSRIRYKQEVQRRSHDLVPEIVEYICRLCAEMRAWDATIHLSHSAGGIVLSYSPIHGITFHDHSSHVSKSRSVSAEISKSRRDNIGH